MNNLDLTFLKTNDAIPPVHLWQPNFCGDMDIVIKANGMWLHNGDEIKRPSLVKLFSRILWREADDYFLVTPVEKVRIQVEDAPFLVTQNEVIEENGLKTIRLLTTTGETIVLGKDSDLILELTPDGERPYVDVRYGMRAMLHRNVYYDLVNMGVERTLNDASHLCIESYGHWFSLGEIHLD